MILAASSTSSSAWAGVIATQGAVRVTATPGTDQGAADTQSPTTSSTTPTTDTTTTATQTASPTATSPTQGVSAVPSAQEAARQRQISSEIQQLSTTDTRVRTHEAAHLAAAGSLAISGANFGYETGPDGKRYAVSGEVNIDTSPGATPQETIARAERIRRAALAPADPSGQDQAVAAMAARMEAAARQQLVAQQVSSYTGKSGASSGSRIDTSA